MSPVEERLLPAIDDDSREFWEWCARGELRVQACGECGRLRMPPRPRCPWCRSAAIEWRATSGRGTVWSYAVPHPPLLPWYGEQAPYNVVVVALDDDPTIRFVGNLVVEPGARLDGIDPHSVTIGEPVVVAFEPIEEGLALPCWLRP